MNEFRWTDASAFDKYSVCSIRGLAAGEKNEIGESAEFAFKFRKSVASAEGEGVHLVPAIDLFGPIRWVVCWKIERMFKDPKMRHLAPTFDLQRTIRAAEPQRGHKNAFNFSIRHCALREVGAIETWIDR